jgi:hypothetical protein
MIYFNNLPIEINIIIASKLNFNTINNFEEVITINYIYLFVFKYPNLNRSINLCFKDIKYEINYKTLYTDLLLFSDPPNYFGVYNRKDILYSYNMTIYSSIYKLESAINIFLNISTLNLLSILSMYKYNSGIINRLKLYPQIHDLALAVNNDIIDMRDQKTIFTIYDTDKESLIIKKYLMTGIINEPITFIAGSINNILAVHFLYFSMICMHVNLSYWQLKFTNFKRK